MFYTSLYNCGLLNRAMHFLNEMFNLSYFHVIYYLPILLMLKLFKGAHE